MILDDKETLIENVIAATLEFERENFIHALHDIYDVPKEAVYDFVYLIEKDVLSKINHPYLDALCVNACQLEYIGDEIMLGNTKFFNDECSNFIKEIIKSIKLKRQLDITAEITVSRQEGRLKMGAIYNVAGHGYIFIGELEKRPLNMQVDTFLCETEIYSLNLSRFFK